MNEEIERYVQEERSRGVGEESIRHALLAKGWDYKIIDDVIIKTRPSTFASLFNREFFRFAFGFITIISIAVGGILVVGALNGPKGEKPCVYNCGK